MENKNFKNISELIGKGLNIKKQSDNKSKADKDEDLFLELVEELSKLEAKSIAAEELGINVVVYETDFYNVIEKLMVQTYGEFGAALTILYCFETSENEKEVNLKDEDGKEYSIKTPKQLYKFIKTWKDK